MIMLPNEAHMKSVGGDRAGHVMVVAHVHVHPHKLAEFLVKAATLLPHCRAEKGNVFENVYRSTACAGNGSDDPCVRIFNPPHPPSIHPTPTPPSRCLALLCARPLAHE